MVVEGLLRFKDHASTLHNHAKIDLSHYSKASLSQIFDLYEPTADCNTATSSTTAFLALSESFLIWLPESLTPLTTQVPRSQAQLFLFFSSSTICLRSVSPAQEYTPQPPPFSLLSQRKSLHSLPSSSPVPQLPHLPRQHFAPPPRLLLHDWPPRCVFSESTLSFLNHVLNPETGLGSTYSLDVFQGLLYPLDKHFIPVEN